MTLAARLIGKPVLVKLAASGEFGEIARMRRIARLTHFFGIRSAARVQAPSAALAQEALSIGIRPERLLRIPNGVDLSKFTAAGRTDRRAARHQVGLREEEVVVLYVGRFARHKGIMDLLAAWSQMERATGTLVLVGSPETMDPAPLPDGNERLVIRPWTADIATYYHAADVFVLPSYVEGMSNVTLEAMACGLAVISSRVGAATEVIEPEHSGLLVEKGDIDALGIAIDRLVADASLRARLGRAAAASIATRYSIQAVTDQIESTYRTMLKEQATS